MRAILFYTISALLLLSCSNQNQDSTAVQSHESASNTASKKKLVAIDYKGYTTADGTKVSVPEFKDSTYTNIILVRHAEKMDDSEDPDLSPEGVVRATHLHELLLNFRIDEFFSTRYNRTVYTIFQAMRHRRKAFQIYNTDDMHALAYKKIKAKHPSNILMAAHSNTIPKILNYLGQTLEYKDLPHDAYDRFYIVSWKPETKAKIHELTY